MNGGKDGTTRRLRSKEEVDGNVWYFEVIWVRTALVEWIYCVIHCERGLLNGDSCTFVPWRVVRDVIVRS